MEASDLDRFQPIDGIAVPAGPAYLAVELDTGRDTLDVTPDDALELIARQHRSPLTLDEGIALVTHRPELLRTHNCFSMLGSRCGDRRVTAMWISRGRPRLGWCWGATPTRGWGRPRAKAESAPEQSRETAGACSAGGRLGDRDDVAVGVGEPRRALAPRAVGEGTETTRARLLEPGRRRLDVR